MALKNALLVAGLMTISTSAFAETLVANIDFPFRAVGKTYPAAKYEVKIASTNGAGPIMTLSNGAGKVNHMFIAIPGDTNNGKAGQPQLVFACEPGGACTLAQVHTVMGSHWQVRQPKLTPAELERLAKVTVPLQVAKAN